MKNPTQLPPLDRTYSKPLRAPKGYNSCLNLPVFGHRDPRGPDNNIRVWVDKSDHLHIRVEKTNRCYKFKKIINAHNCVEIIAT